MKNNLIITKRGPSDYLELAMKLQHQENPLGDFSDVIGQDVVEFSLTLSPKSLAKYVIVINILGNERPLTSLMKEMDKNEKTKKFLDNIGRDGIELTYGTERYILK